MQDAAKLTEREMQVLGMKAKGQTYKAIGMALGIKGTTALQYAAHAREKLGVGTMFEAVLKAVNLGLIESSPPL